MILNILIIDIFYKYIEVMFNIFVIEVEVAFINCRNSEEDSGRLLYK